MKKKHFIDNGDWLLCLVLLSVLVLESFRSQTLLCTGAL